MELRFWKYQGTGNDFVIFDGRDDVSGIKDNKAVIAKLCDRRFGIGADGLIIIEPDEERDFKMVYYNSDGAESTMCGNGGRCSVAFAQFRGFSDRKTIFNAIDGEHHANISKEAWVDLGMINVSSVKKIDDKTYELFTGSPHYVYFPDSDEEIDIYEFGRNIRYSDTYKKEGINVNVVRKEGDAIRVETYERGVEDETYSCGTGVTAAAIAYAIWSGSDFETRNAIPIITKGGKLEVSFDSESGNRFRDIVLSGPAVKVFEGVIQL